MYLRVHIMTTREICIGLDRIDHVWEANLNVVGGALYQIVIFKLMNLFKTKPKD